MSARSRNKRKLKRKQKEALQPQNLIREARKKLSQKNSTDAINLLKQLPTNESEKFEVQLLKFFSFTHRARELNKEGKTSAAASMHKQADRYRVKILPNALSDVDLAEFLDALPLKDAISTFNVQRISRPQLGDIEQRLAGRIVTSGSWDVIKEFKDGHPIKIDADCMKNAVSLMNGAKWENAAEAMRELPRTSPYAPWRVFCKAMVSYAAEDKKNLTIALKILPENFILRDTISELQKIAGTKKNNAIRENSDVQSALGMSTSELFSVADKFRSALQSNTSEHVFFNLIRQLSKLISPNDPLPVMIDLYVIMAVLQFSRDNSYAIPYALAKRLFPGNRVDAIVGRAEFALARGFNSALRPSYVFFFFEGIFSEYSDPKDIIMAKACLFELLARRISLLQIYNYSTEKNYCGKLLGQEFINLRTLTADIMDASLKNDPKNMKGYNYLFKILNEMKAPKARKRQLLKKMTQHFPLDVKPWLQLAELDLSSQAYRRAEKALIEAEKLAPYNERVLDLQVISLLNASDRSLKSKKLELAESDLIKAQQINREKLKEVVTAKNVFMKIILFGNVDEALKKHLNNTSIVFQLRVICILYQYTRTKRKFGQFHLDLKIARDLSTSLNRLKPSLAKVSQEDLVHLVSPLPNDVIKLLDYKFYIAPAIRDYWPNILSLCQDHNLLYACDYLLENHGFYEVREEISKRVGNCKDDEMRLSLSLYLAVIDYIQFRNINPQRFIDIFNEAKPSQRKSLRASAARLANITKGDLRKALLHFDFSDLKPPLDLKDLLNLDEEFDDDSNSR